MRRRQCDKGVRHATILKGVLEKSKVRTLTGYEVNVFAAKVSTHAHAHRQNTLCKIGHTGQKSSLAQKSHQTDMHEQGMLPNTSFCDRMFK